MSAAGTFQAVFALAEQVVELSRSAADLAGDVIDSTEGFGRSAQNQVVGGLQPVRAQLAAAVAMLDAIDSLHALPSKARNALAERKAAGRNGDVCSAQAVADKARKDLGLELAGCGLVDLLADQFPTWSLGYCREIAAQVTP